MDFRIFYNDNKTLDGENCSVRVHIHTVWKLRLKKKRKNKNLYLKGEKEALSQPAKSVKLTQWADQPVANERYHTFFYFMTNCDTLLLSYAILKVMLSGIASHLDFPEVNCHFLFYISLLQHYFKDTHEVDWEKSTTHLESFICMRIGLPSGPVVKTSPSNSIPGWGAKIPHASWTKTQSIEQKHYSNKFNKDFKIDLH